MANLLSAAGAVLLAVLPLMSQDRPRVVRVSRSARQSNFRELMALSKSRITPRPPQHSRRRLAVLPFVQRSKRETRSAGGAGIMFAMAEDLRYVPAYLVLDSATILSHAESTVPGEPIDEAKLSAIGRKLGAELVISGTYGEEMGTLSVSARLYELSGEKLRVVARSNKSGPSEHFNTLCDGVLNGLLSQAGTLPDAERRTEMSRVPTKSLTARRACDRGFLRLHQADIGRRHELIKACEESLALAESALRADPTYMRAYLLVATCLEALDRQPELHRRLREARSIRNDMTAGKLTLLELEADYARFVDGDPALALARYEQMLDTDATHPVALWSAIECYLAEAEGPPAAEDLEAAAQFAARLVAAHPNSSLAAFLIPPDSGSQ